jgi:O-antigen/teichoic acid export membrane protein
MAKNYFYNLLLTVANLLFPLVSFPYVSRVLGPEGIGKVQFAFSFAQYFGMIAGFGIPIYGMREIARHRTNVAGRSKVFLELVTIYVITSVSMSVIYLAAIYLFPYFSADREIYLAALLMILLGCSYIEWLYTGMEEFKSVALRSVLFKIAGLILIFLLVKTPADYKLYLYIMMFSFLGNNILSFFLLKGKIIFSFADLSLRKHVKPLLLIFGTTTVAVMADIDTVLLGFLSNDKAVGLYTAAVKISKISVPIITSMSIIMIPKITKEFAGNEMDKVQNSLSQAFGFLVFLCIPVTFGLALLAPEFIALFSGDEFLDATNAMRILSTMPVILGFAHFFLFLILVPAGKNREMFAAEIGGLIVSLLLNFILIPVLQQVGSAIANVCAELVVTLMYLYFVKKHFSFTYNWSLFINATISALAFIPVILLTKEIPLLLVYRLIISVACCAAAYFAIQLFIFKSDFLLAITRFIKLKFTDTTGNQASNL